MLPRAEFGKVEYSSGSWLKLEILIIEPCDWLERDGGSPNHNDQQSLEQYDE